MSEIFLKLTSGKRFTVFASLHVIINHVKLLLQYKELVPKAPMTAFFQFLTAKREKLVEKHPELQAREVAKKLSEKWKSLSDERKEKYKFKYRMEKEKYVQDLEQFYEDYPEAKPSSPIRKRYMYVHHHSPMEKEIYNYHQFDYY